MPVKIEGLPELDRRLKTLPRKVAQKHLTNSVRKGALPVRADAKRRVRVVTGKLKANIFYFSIRTRNRTYAAEYGVSVRSDGVFYGKAGWRSGGPRDDPRNAYYWTFVEFGTKNRPARPFLRPAFESQKREADRAIRKNLLIGVETEATKLR